MMVSLPLGSPIPVEFEGGYIIRFTIWFSCGVSDSSGSRRWINRRDDGVVLRFWWGSKVDIL
eukprot:2974295-Ditylum_brightwellii.AAC.1